MHPPPASERAPVQWVCWGGKPISHGRGGCPFAHTAWCCSGGRGGGAPSPPDGWEGLSTLERRPRQRGGRGDDGGHPGHSRPKIPLLPSTDFPPARTAAEGAAAAAAASAVAVVAGGGSIPRTAPSARCIPRAGMALLSILRLTHRPTGRIASLWQPPLSCHCLIAFGDREATLLYVIELGFIEEREKNMNRENLDCSVTATQSRGTGLRRASQCQPRALVLSPAR